MSNVYQPGVCNIGPAEIRMRRRSGWLGLAITVILFVVLVAFHVPWPWRLFLLIPAGLGATGFLQSALHFCVKFGMSGLFNFGDDTTKQETVYEADYRRKDQQKAVSIIIGAVVIAIAVVVIAVFIP